MRITIARFYSCLILVLILLSGLAQSSVTAQETRHEFPETGKAVQGAFFKYWETHGGLAQQGYPISNEFTEVSDSDGKSYTVQYFQRAVFEYHPELSTQNKVLLSLLGAIEYPTRYSNGAPGQIPNTASGSVLFRETGKRVGARFYSYWINHGGLAQQGYPISDEFLATSPLDGKIYLIQYFERAVFEFHPELAFPNDVLLSQLGWFRYQTHYATSGEPKGQTSTAIVTRVIDGDTIEVSIGGVLYRVRYIGMNTPETVAPGRPVECYGPQASAKNKELVGGKTVTLVKDVREVDVYGRLLRYVYVGNLFVNAELVSLGYANAATYPPDVKYADLFRSLEAEARAAHRGLWAVGACPP